MKERGKKRIIGWENRANSTLLFDKPEKKVK